MNTVEMIETLQQTVVELVKKNPKATTKALCKACEKKMGITPIRFDAVFVKKVCAKFNVQWSGKK